jgi:hypothetical protein
MGMFDTIIVHNKFLPLLKEMGELGYEYDSFQTKDLENSLLEYFVDEDGVLRKTVYTYDQKESDKIVYHFEERIKHKSIIKEEYTGEVLFYDIMSKEDTDQLFVELKITFINGVANKVAQVINVNREKIEEIEKRSERISEIHKARNNDPIYQIGSKISNLLHKLSIIFQKISFDIRRKIDKLHPLYSKNYEQEK